MSLFIALTGIFDKTRNQFDGIVIPAGRKDKQEQRMASRSIYWCSSKSAMRHSEITTEGTILHQTYLQWIPVDHYR